LRQFIVCCCCQCFWIISLVKCSIFSLFCHSSDTRNTNASKFITSFKFIFIFLLQMLRYLWDCPSLKWLRFVFWVVMPCGYGCSSKHWYLPTHPHVLQPRRPTSTSSPKWESQSLGQLSQSLTFTALILHLVNVFWLIFISVVYRFECQH
jgi:hypothetical protein